MPFVILFLFLSTQPLLAKENVITVVVTLKPIFLLVKDIVGGALKVELISNIDSHHDLLLKPSDVSKLANADLVFYEGFGIHNLLMHYKNTVNLSEGIKLLMSRRMNSINSFINAKHYDQHFWLNPKHSIAMSRRITTKLAELDPANAELYKKNLEILVQSINESIDISAKKLAKFKNHKYIVIHDAYQYFEKHFGLSNPIGYFYNVEHIMANTKLIQSLLSSVENNDIKCVISDTESGKKVLGNLLKKTNFTLIDPVGNNVTYTSYPKFLDEITDKFVSCLQ